MENMINIKEHKKAMSKNSRHMESNSNEDLQNSQEEAKSEEISTNEISIVSFNSMEVVFNESNIHQAN